MMLALAVQVLVIGALSVLTPVLSRQTTPLGVSIPSGYIGHPVVHAAVRTYQLFSGGVTVLVLILLPAVPPAAVDLAFAVAPLSVLGGSCLAYVWQRRRIVEAKNAGHWYQGRQVGISARLTQGSGAGVAGVDGPVPVWPMSIGLACLVSTIAYGIARYDGLPDPYPAHTDVTGDPTRWVPKTPVEVFFGPGVSLVVLIALTVVFWWLPRRPRRGLPDGDAAPAAVRREVHEHTTRVILTWVALILGVGVGALTLLTWTGNWGAATAAALAVMLTAVMAAVSLPVLRLLPVLKALDSSIEPGRDRESPDDDRYWKFGLLYVNRDDPAILVPYRAGIGMTINMGHPVGMAFMAAVILVLIWSIVVGG